MSEKGFRCVLLKRTALLRLLSTSLLLSSLSTISTTIRKLLEKTQAAQAEQLQFLYSTYGIYLDKTSPTCSQWQQPLNAQL